MEQNDRNDRLAGVRRGVVLAVLCVSLVGCGAWGNSLRQTASGLMGQNIQAAYAEWGQEHATRPAQPDEKGGARTEHVWDDLTADTSQEFVQTGSEYVGQQIVGMQTNVGGSQSPIIQDQYQPIGYYQTTALRCTVVLVTDARDVIVDYSVNSCGRYNVD
ncbi:hypothetical protein BWR60_33085 [Inquilinus limosus]|uniref:Uncharacterized protein n=1 Tax=Inquilinus limosus TaxID=171674 RepID=A0A211Z087_9PROT|nr:hypothetical protein BWR60_33085 [Inquilinus limosus]